MVVSIGWWFQIFYRGMVGNHHFHPFKNWLFFATWKTSAGNRPWWNHQLESPEISRYFPVASQKWHTNSIEFPGVRMVFPMFSQGFRMFFLCFPGVRMVFPMFSQGFRLCFPGVRMVFPMFSQGFRMGGTTTTTSTDCLGGRDLLCSAGALQVQYCRGLVGKTTYWADVPDRWRDQWLGSMGYFTYL